MASEISTHCFHMFLNVLVRFNIRKGVQVCLFASLGSYVKCFWYEFLKTLMYCNTLVTLFFEWLDVTSVYSVFK